jgi:ABC-2 type transport system ATP-binding protein
MNNGGGKAVVEVGGLSMTFGRTVALHGVDLAVPRGVVFGLVGENGSGKTTLIRHMLGLLRAQAGVVRVFGLDPVCEPVEVLSRVGYLSEDRDLPDWMRVGELLLYLKAFYPAWDNAYADELRVQFELDPTARIQSLSQGQRARLGLLGALAYRPELLVLDEPSTGLDPVVRRDILGAIVRTIADEGRTVFFSSHLLDEVERVSDHVAMIDRGRIVLDGPLDEIKLEHRRVTLRFDVERTHAPALRGSLAWEGDGHEWTAVCRCPVDQVAHEAASLGARVVEERVPTLDEIFVARIRARRSVPVEA